LPDEILSEYLTVSEIERFRSGGTGIFSITVYAVKPSNSTKVACTPGSGCC